MLETHSSVSPHSLELSDSELAKYGNLLEVHVCDNVGDHLIGNVYARYEMETEAQAAVDSLNNRWYAGKFSSHQYSPCNPHHTSNPTPSHPQPNPGRPLYAELSPVTDFREACCRQNENGECNRGGFCNFMHLRLASKPIYSELQAGLRLERRLNGADGGKTTGGWVPPSEREKSVSGKSVGGGSASGRRSASPSGRRGSERYDRR